MMIDLLVNFIMRISVFIFMVYLAPSAIKFVKGKLTAQQYQLLVFTIQQLVAAAEQIYNEVGTGKNKKQYVYEQLQKKGVQVSLEEFDELVESAVFELNKYKK